MQPKINFGCYNGERLFKIREGGVRIEDREIITLFFKRDENAIAEIEKKYGRYCYYIAYNILYNQADAEECVNDTWMNAWSSIPPNFPAVLSAYLAKLTRFVSIKKWRDSRRIKRGGGEIALVYEELSECIQSYTTVDSEIETKRVADILNSFIDSLEETEQKIFVCRYWYFDSISTISKQFGFTGSKVKSILYRTRKKLLTYLEREGVNIGNR